MKKIIIAVLLLCAVPLFSQETESEPISLPRLEDRMDNFFKFRDEVFPEDFSGSLDDLKKIPPSKGYTIEKTVEGDHFIVKFYAKGKLMIRQSYTKKGIADGVAVVYHPNGIVRQEIPFVIGVAEGLGKANSDSGFLEAETTYKNNKRHGLRTIHAYRGGDIEGTFINGTVTGKIKVQDSRGVIYYYPPDMKKGIVEVYYGTLKAAEIPIIDAEVADGEQKEFSKDGKLKNSIRFSKGKRNGLSEHYKADGTLLFANNYRNGEHIGKYTYILDNGTVVKEGQYDDSGLMTGLWTFKNTAGKTEREVNYKDGKLNGLYTGYVNGILSEKTEYVNGKKEGLTRLYDKTTGTLTTEKHYKNDETESYKSFYPDGKVLASFATNIDRSSSVVYYDPQGKIINESKYNQKRQPIGVHMLIMLDGNSYKINNVSTYDTTGKLLKQLLYAGPGNKNYIEINYDGEVKHGPRTDYNAQTNEKTVTYYFRDKLVTEKEFIQLSEKKKP